MLKFSHFPVCLFIGVSFAVGLGKNSLAANGDENDPLVIEGPIQKIQDPLAELVNLKWVNGILEIDMPESYDEAEGPIDTIREEFGYGDGSSYGSPTYRLGFGESKLKGFVERTRIRRSKYRTAISVRENIKPFRNVLISTNENGDLTAIIRSPKDAYLLKIHQQEDKQFVVQEINGTEVFTTRVRNFDAFMTLHREFAVNRVLPTLKNFGVGTLMSPFNDEVQQQVIQHLQPLSSQQQMSAEELIEQLNSDVYEERETITNQLRSEFPKHLELMKRMYVSKNYSPEVRSRLRTVILDKADQEDIDLLNFLVSNDLANEISYVVWMLNNKLDQQQKQLVQKHFRELTGEKINPDSPGWSEWVNSQPFSKTDSLETSGSFEPVDFQNFHIPGTLTKANEHTSQIIRIHFVDNSLALDRSIWEKPFGGKQIEELVKELEAEFKKRKIPDSWLNEGGRYAMSRTGHVQVIFELMCEAMNGETVEYTDPYNNHADADGWQMTFTSGKMRASLNIAEAGRKQRRRRRKDRNTEKEELKLFHYFIEETAEPYRQLAVDESTEAFSLNFACHKQDVSIQMVQTKDSVILQDMRGLEVRAMKEANFRALYENNREYFDKELYPVLQHMGFQLASELAAPLNENTSVSQSESTVDETESATEQSQEANNR